MEPVVTVNIMNGKKIDRLRNELKGLLQKQTETLTGQTFCCLSQEEWFEFERRRERIHDLTVLLLTLTPPADQAA